MVFCCKTVALTKKITKSTTRVVGFFKMFILPKLWRSLAERDDQPDWPNSQTCMDLQHNFLEFDINTIAYHLGRYSLHLLLPKSSIPRYYHHSYI